MRLNHRRLSAVRIRKTAIACAIPILSERLEPRTLLTAIPVINTNDTGPGSLRDAIDQSNATVGVEETITFQIPGSGPYTIAPATDLPLITDPVIIDATTQTGFTGSPIVELTGASDPTTAYGLEVDTAGGGSTIRGFVIDDFLKVGIILHSDGNTVAGNYIGTNAAGTAASANGSEGILIEQGSKNTIGGTTDADRNIISGNTLEGVNIEGLVIPAVLDPNTNAVITPAQLVDASGNDVIGNYIGTDVTGALPIGNGNSGVTIFEATANDIGGFGAGSGNVISANGMDGVQISTAIGDDALGASTNFVGGNKIGVDVTGKIDTNLGNVDDGIHIIGGQENTIGDVGAARNIISGNGNDGIEIVDSTQLGPGPSADFNIIQDNYIGTDVDGTTALGNTGNGIFVEAGNHTGIGGAAEGNLISGNGGNGIALSAGKILFFSISTDSTFIGGNTIGLDATGKVLGNGGNGIDLEGDSNTRIGGSDDADTNVISGNDGYGISVSSFDVSIAGGSTTTADIEGNTIGLDPADKLARPNKLDGISITPLVGFGSSATSIAGNFISGNTGAGISATGGDSDVIQANSIGVDVNGNSLGNGKEGILLNNSTNETIGGTASGVGNVIAFNGAAGVAVTGLSAGVAIQQNSIYENTGIGIDLGNNGITPNDIGTQDADTGPNGLQNFPVLTSVVSTGSTTEIKGTLDSGANTTFLMELFSNDSGDPTGQGRTHLLGVFKTTSAAGTTAFDDILSVGLTAGQFVTATATDDSTKDTSEFSAPLTATITPTNPTISINDVSMTEGNSGTKNFNFTVKLSAASSTETDVFYATANGSAIEPGDYIKVPSTKLVFTAGQTSKTITVKVNGDTTVEGNETFFVNLTSPTNGTITDSQGKGTIVNDDTAPSGTVSVVTDPCDSTKTALKFVGTSGNDVIVVTNASPSVQGRSTVVINGVNKGTFNFTGRILGYGGNGSDKITIDSHITRTAQIYGEAGNDTISGGSGNDLLFGGDGNDQLNGNAGRDILVGQLNNDSLNGGAGEDILIAGSTNYDTNAEAWCDIQQEWFRTDLAYAARVKHILNGGGKNGSFKLNASDVFSAGQQPDTLMGSSDSDLFFAASSGDKLTDRTSGETEVIVHS